MSNKKWIPFITIGTFLLITLFGFQNCSQQQGLSKSLINSSNTPDSQYPDTTLGGLTGYLDYSERFNDGSVVITGWACQKGNTAPISVKVYIKESFNDPNTSEYTTSLASSERESLVQQVCGSNHTYHGFQISIPFSVAGSTQKFLSVVAQAPDGTNTLELTSNNDFANRIPLPIGEIKGQFLQPTPEGNNFKITGWACIENSREQIYIHAYAGSFAQGNAQFIKAAIANQQSQSTVGVACNTGHTMHGFQITLQPTDIVKFQGRTLSIYGLHNDPSKNNLPLVGSDQYIF